MASTGLWTGDRGLEVGPSPSSPFILPGSFSLVDTSGPPQATMDDDAHPHAVTGGL